MRDVRVRVREDLEGPASSLVFRLLAAHRRFGRAAVAAAWRSANPERVSAYNEGRRAPAFPRERVRA